jgi:hypothetical protein
MKKTPQRNTATPNKRSNIAASTSKETFGSGLLFISLGFSAAC